MYTLWTQGAKSLEEKENIKKEIYGAQPVLDRLGIMIQKELDALEVAEISPKFYETPNWDYKQAHTNGFKSAIRMVLKIINLDDQRDNNEQSIRPE